MRGIDAQKNEALKNCKAKPKDVDIVGLEKNHNILFTLQKFRCLMFMLYEMNELIN